MKKYLELLAEFLKRYKNQKWYQIVCSNVGHKDIRTISALKNRFSMTYCNRCGKTIKVTGTKTND